MIHYFKIIEALGAGVLHSDTTRTVRPAHSWPLGGAERTAHW